jgi:hypothetical protein
MTLEVLLRLQRCSRNQTGRVTDQEMQPIVPITQA